MLRKICLGLSLALMLSLSACSSFTGKTGYFHDRTQGYLKATSTAPLAFPKGSEPQGIEDDYPVPSTATNAQQAAPVSTLPPDLLNK